jgi:plasmid maintenance system antidote protein VapI
VLSLNFDHANAVDVRPTALRRKRHGMAQTYNPRAQSRRKLDAQEGQTMAFEAERSTNGADHEPVLGVADGPRHEWLQYLLYDKHLTQRKLADAWDLDESGISRFIRWGERRLTTERIKKLAALVDMSPDDLRSHMEAAQPDYDEVEANEASVVSGAQGALDRLGRGCRSPKRRLLHPPRRDPHPARCAHDVAVGPVQT